MNPLSLVTVMAAVTCTSVAAADGRFWPTGARWKAAIATTVRDPGTWVPAAGAALFGLTGLDREVSDWAVQQTPVFGSPEQADQWSDDLRDATRIGMYASAAAAPFRQRTWRERGQLVLASVASVSASGKVTSTLKDWTDRERPDGSDSRSFPSGHASAAFTYALQASHNVDALRLPRPAAKSLKIGLTTLASGTAWARVEAGRHFPSDVLASAALSSLLTGFFNGALLPPDSAASLALDASPEGLELALRWRF